MLRQALLGVSRSPTIQKFAVQAPVTRQVVERFVAGESATDAVQATRSLAAAGLLTTLDRLGEDTTERAQADAVAGAYAELLGLLTEAGLTPAAEVSVKLSALG